MDISLTIASVTSLPLSSFMFSADLSRIKSSLNSSFSSVAKRIYAMPMALYGFSSACDAAPMYPRYILSAAFMVSSRTSSMFLNRPNIGFTEQPSSPASDLAVRLCGPPRRIIFNDASISCSFVNINFGGIMRLLNASAMLRNSSCVYYTYNPVFGQQSPGNVRLFL